MTKLFKTHRRISSLFIVAILSLGFFGATRAQEPVPAPAPAIPANHKAELHQALLDLTNPFTVMCVAAHPDDEDGTTLTLLRRKFGVHTVSLFSTYGEGGQNAFGPETLRHVWATLARMMHPERSRRFTGIEFTGARSDRAGGAGCRASRRRGVPMVRDAARV